MIHQHQTEWHHHVLLSWPPTVWISLQNENQNPSAATPIFSSDYLFVKSTKAVKENEKSKKEEPEFMMEFTFRRQENIMFLLLMDFGEKTNGDASIGGEHLRQTESHRHINLKMHTCHVRIPIINIIKKISYPDDCRLLKSTCEKLFPFASFWSWKFWNKIIIYAIVCQGSPPAFSDFWNKEQNNSWCCTRPDITLWDPRSWGSINGKKSFNSQNRDTEG